MLIFGCDWKELQIKLEKGGFRMFTNGVEMNVGGGQFSILFNRMNKQTERPAFVKGLTRS